MGSSPTPSAMNKGNTLNCYYFVVMVKDNEDGVLPFISTDLFELVKYSSYRIYSNPIGSWRITPPYELQYSI